MNNLFPSISILIPTLNAASVLEKCLQAITIQDYPKDKLEIIIADGGSTDKTLAMAKKYQAKIYQNPLKTAEAGKAVALRYAQGELIALIDSDNILPSADWLKKMVEPFADKQVIGSEPWEYTYRPQDGFIDRWCALMGMNDPLCYFLGNYDRLNILSGKWTGLPLRQVDQGNWLKVWLKPPRVPTVGANGTLLRRQKITQSGLVEDYFFDIDVIAQLARKKSIMFAKVKVGIIHLYCGSDIKKFIRKQTRRIRDYFYFQKLGIRRYPWKKQSKRGLLLFTLSCLTILPLLYQLLRGFSKKPDWAWIFHPLACWLTLGVYFWGGIQGIFHASLLSRRKWGQ